MITPLVNVTTPSLSVAPVPISVTVIVSPSTSTSLLNTSMILLVVPATTLVWSTLVSGASLTAVTLISTVASSRPPLPSLTMYVKLSVPT